MSPLRLHAPASGLRSARLHGEAGGPTEPPRVRAARATLAREKRWEVGGYAAIVMGVAVLVSGMAWAKPYQPLEGLGVPVVALGVLLLLSGPLAMAAHAWAHRVALAAAQAQVDAWDAAVAARVVEAARPPARPAASEAPVGPRWAAAAPVVDALLGLDLPAPVRAAVAAARAELRATAAALQALAAVGTAPDPEGQRSQRCAAVTAGLIARFDALLGSVEELLLEQAARRVQADDPVVARVRDEVARSVALREVEGAVAGRAAR